MKHVEDYSRQSFLGEDAQDKISTCVVGVVGLGGGGSHIAQQLAHLGFMNYVLFDADVIEASNLNRLIGGTERDVRLSTPKVQIAERLIKGVRPSAQVRLVRDVWQNNPQALAGCDLIFGCVDGFDQRRQLEAASRRYLVPLIDVGMDVFQSEDSTYAMAGQVILSMPSCPCMTCMGFLNERTLAREAAAYGAAGAQPQVVWANGVLASTAVGIAVDLLTDWSGSLRQHVYLSFRGNQGTLMPHARLPFVPDGPCPHFPLDACGAPRFKKL